MFKIEWYGLTTRTNVLTFAIDEYDPEVIVANPKWNAVWEPYLKNIFSDEKMVPNL